MRLLATLLAAVLAVLPAPVASAQSEAFEGLEIVGNELGVTTLSPAEVRAIFRGERALWSTGQRVTVVLPSTRAEYVEAFADQILGMRPAAMQRHWLALVFQGRAEPPVPQETVAAALEFVARTPGAIAVLPRGSAPPSLVIRVR